MNTDQHQFGPYRLDPSTGELFDGDELVRLEPLPTRILVRLVERAGQMVSRQELRELGWPRLPGAAQQSLNTCIRQIRHALSDDASRPTYVETLRGRGYRFVAPVRTVRTPAVADAVPAPVVADGPMASPPASSAGPRRLRARASVFSPASVAKAPVGAPAPVPAVGTVPAARAALAVLAAVAVAALVAFPGTWMSASDDAQLLRISVEPAEVGPGVVDPDVFGRGLAEEMRVALAMLAPTRLEVLGRASTERMSARDGGADAAALGLGITHRLSLSVRAPEEGVLRVVARMVDVERGTVTWGGAVDATPQSVGTAAGVLVGEMARSLGMPAPPSPSTVADVPVQVRRGLMKARYVFETHGDLAVAVAALDSVLVLRPALADAQGLRAEVLLRQGRGDEAARAAARALERDPHHAGALRAAAGVQMLEGSWAEARASLDRALARQPNDAATLTALAFLLTVTERFDEAERALERALRTDPLSPLVTGDAGLLHLWAGRFDRAAEACRETLELDAEALWALGCAFDALSRSGRTADAADVGRAILERYGVAAGSGPLASDGAVLARVRRWRVEAWEEAVRNGDSPYYLAVAYADVGRTADALRHLDDAARHPSMAVLSMAVEPRLRPLTDRAEFRSTLARLRLPAASGRS